MNKTLRVTGLGLLAALVAVQFVPTPRNTGPTEGPASLAAREKVSGQVKAMLQRACYDCHSDNTKYPWYAAVQPVAWWMNQHVTDGKAELNFSDFARYDTKRTVRKLQAVADEVRDHGMPLASYRLMHPEARLTDAEIALLAKWAEDLADDIQSR
ncbi:heme-binding domain-containing protein [Opitutus sp. GAS368]|jgi:hypothetical protein|uniref:heme-binding domain-containing protein n=1 Tax=Opitutus sp. GAS368 TaxID=1882749 RepID=UPI00087A9230|nr:heme-binding domain-containing protein [Opitutus sp. GAS368]SDR68073.1 Haem-binding domain-containing protein [Opitutus sp. GAS368]